MGDVQFKLVNGEADRGDVHYALDTKLGAFGDLTGDGAGDAAVILDEIPNLGGAFYLLAFRNRGGAPVQVGRGVQVGWAGDDCGGGFDCRLAPSGISISSGKILLTLKGYPSGKVTRQTWAVTSSGLVKR